eukprot:285219-Prymnesium_polylepis.1
MVFGSSLAERKGGPGPTCYHTVVGRVPRKIIERKLWRSAGAGEHCIQGGGAQQRTWPDPP